MGDYYATAEWEKVNTSTSRLDVPGGHLYKVIPGGGQPSHVVFVADLSHAITGAAFHLGTGNASTHMGAIEAHSVMVKEAGDRIADSLDGLARAIESRE